MQPQSTQMQSRTTAAIADRIQDIVSNPAAGACLGATLCLLALRRIRGLDLVVGAAGAGLLYQSLSRRVTQRAAEACHSAARAPQQIGPSRTSRPVPAAPAADEVDEASEESFPGSDPPAFTGTSASRAVPIKHS
jgi:hypothetical protein